MPVWMWWVGQPGSKGSSTRLVQPNGCVTRAPGTTADTGSLRWLGTWAAATSMSTTPPATIASRRITPSPGRARSVERREQRGLELVHRFLRAAARARHLADDQE